MDFFFKKKNDMIDVSHKIKCTHKGTPILCYIKKLQTVHAYRNILPGKADDEWDFLQLFTAMIQNNYVQTARPPQSSYRVYTQKVLLSDGWAEMELPQVYSTEQ